jgi:hypothetical protein
MMLGWTYSRDRGRRNDNFVWEDYRITMRVSTKNDANLEERLDTLVTEIYRIITPTNVTGYHDVDIIREDRSPSSREKEVFAAHLTVEARVYSTASAVTPGSVATSSWTIDDLTVNNDMTVGGTAEVTGVLSAYAGLYAAVTNNLRLHHDGADAYLTSALGDLILGAGDVQIVGDLTVTGGDLTLGSTAYSEAALADLLMFGSANAAYTPCIFEGAGDLGTVGKFYFDIAAGGVANVDGTNLYLFYRIPLATNRGTLKLYVDDLRLGVHTADATDYVTKVRVYGVNHTGVTELLSDSSNRTAQGSYVSAFAATDTSSYESVLVRVDCVCGAQGELIVEGVEIKTYYA